MNPTTPPPVGGDELRKRLEQLPVKEGHAKLKDVLFDDEIQPIMQLITTYTEGKVKEARDDENNRWKVVAEEIVEKDGVYRAVNYLNERSIELHRSHETSES